jgi:hypothetical protein
MISFESKGSFVKTEGFLRRMMTGEIYRALNGYGEQGVAALSEATPRDSGTAAGAWSYRVSRTGRHWVIAWYNSNTENGFPVAIMLQYGHGTGTGGYVAGQDYINPAIKPIFDQIANAVWREVTRK